MAMGEVRAAPFNGVCMHVPEVTCGNCMPTFHYRPDDYYYWRRNRWVEPPTVPKDDVVVTDSVKVDNTFDFNPCSGGHDFVACDGHVICNVCEKVVKVSE